MTRSSARLLHIASLLVIGSGAIWAYLRYVHDLGPEPEDPVLAMEWSGIHPWGPALRNLHLLAAPLLVFAVGLIWSGHVAPRLFRPWARRATGLGLALLFGPMVITGVSIVLVPGICRAGCKHRSSVPCVSEFVQRTMLRRRVFVLPWAWWSNGHQLCS